MQGNSHGEGAWLSYRVGVKTTPKMAEGSSAHFCSMGTAKATVLPDPVLLPPMQSRPLRTSGIHPFWMPVGRLMAMLASDCTSHGRTFNDSKVVLGSVAARILRGGSAASCRGRDCLGWRLMREGASIAETMHSSSSLSGGDILGFFRDPGLSRTSDPWDSDPLPLSSDPSRCDEDGDGASPAAAPWPAGETALADLASLVDDGDICGDSGIPAESSAATLVPDAASRWTLRAAVKF